MKKARMNISHSCFILSKLKIFGEIVTSLPFFFADFVQFGFCLIRDFVHLGFCPIWGFIQYEILSVWDFVQFEILYFKILSNLRFCP